MGEATILVTWLPPALDERGVEGLFSSCGMVKHVQLLRSPGGVPNGCAYVTFVEMAAATAAAERYAGKYAFRGAAHPLEVLLASAGGSSPPRDAAPSSPPPNQVLAAEGEAAPMRSPVVPGSSSSASHSSPAAAASAASTTTASSIMHPQQQQQQQQPLYTAVAGGQFFPPPYFLRPHHVGAPAMPGLPVQHAHYDQAGGLGHGCDFGSGGGGGGVLGPAGSDGMYCGSQRARGRGNRGRGAGPGQGGSHMGWHSSAAMGKPGIPLGRRQQTAGPNMPGTNISSDQCINVYVYNLPANMGSAELTGLFEPFGSVVLAHVYLDKATGRSRGFGCVTYTSLVAAEEALLAMDNYPVGHKRLFVSDRKVPLSEVFQKTRQSKNIVTPSPPAMTVPPALGSAASVTPEGLPLWEPVTDVPADRGTIQWPRPMANSVGPVGSPSSSTSAVSAASASAAAAAAAGTKEHQQRLHALLGQQAGIWQEIGSL